MTNKQNKGVYWAILTAIISGVSIFINKFAVDAISQPLVFTTVKNCGVAIILLGILGFSGKWKKLLKVSGRELKLLGLVGIVGGALPFYLFFTGLASIPAINGALIHKTLVIWVAIAAGKLLKEKVSKTTVLAMGLLFGANLLVGGFSGFRFSFGELLVLMSTLLWATETIIIKRLLPGTDPDVLTAARMGFGGIVLLGISLWLQPTALANSFNLGAMQWFWLVLTTVTLLGYVTSWYRALKLAPATTVTAILAGSTLVTNILSAIFVTHTFNYLLLVQAVMIVTGVAGLWMSETGKRLFAPKEDLPIATK